MSRLLAWTIVLFVAGSAADVMLAAQGSSWTPVTWTWLAISVACFVSALIIFGIWLVRFARR